MSGLPDPKLAHKPDVSMYVMKPRCNVSHVRYVRNVRNASDVCAAWFKLGMYTTRCSGHDTTRPLHRSFASDIRCGEPVLQSTVDDT